MRTTNDKFHTESMKVFLNWITKLIIVIHNVTLITIIAMCKTDT